MLGDPSNIKSSPKCWKILKEVAPPLNRKNGARPLPMVQLANGDVAQTHLEARERWQEHFSGIELGQIEEYDKIVATIRDGRIKQVCVDTLQNRPTVFDSELACRSLNTSSAPGPDGISPPVFYQHASSLSRLVAPLYFKSAALSQEPLAFEESTQAELYKGTGKHEEVKNSRGIVCANTLGKPFNSFCRKKALLLHISLDVGNADWRAHWWRDGSVLAYRQIFSTMVHS